MPKQAATTLVEVATRALRAEILTGDLAPGARIHLNEAAERLSMSPVPIREALRELTAEGLVIALSQRGYRVRQIGEADLDDTYRLRCVLDPMAIELAVPKMTFDDFARAERALTALTATYQTDDWTAHGIHHREFHFALYEPCDSPWLLHTMNMLWENSVRYQILSTHRRGSIEDRAREHRLIFDACVARDAELAREMIRRHLTHTWETVRSLLSESTFASAEQS